MNNGKLQMEGSKLLWHLDRVTSWQQGERIAPLHIDVGLSKSCNIRCEYCFGSMQGNRFVTKDPRAFPREGLLRYVTDAGAIGVRSMAFIGEAEPLLNPAVYEAIVAGKKAGVDIALGSNGILYEMSPAGEEALEYLTWLRFNISAASAEGYKRIHNSDDFEIAMQKIRYCVGIKRQKNLDVTIGLQMVLTPSNRDQVVGLAKLGRELGVDYLVVKQCSDTPDSALGIYDHLKEYRDFNELLQEAEAQATDDYKVIIKWNMIENEGARNYDVCYAPPFLLYSSGDGKLFPCGAFFDHRVDEFCMGDLVEQSFRQIIESDRYWDVVERVKQLDVHCDCYSNCRSHFVNDFLWQVKHPPQHVNFI